MSYNQIVPQQKRVEHRIALFGCPHCNADLSFGRESITEAMNSQGREGLRVNEAFILGDFAATQAAIESPSDDVEGSAVANQLNGQIIHRQCIYCLRGNHDAGKSNYDWFNKWIDPFGVNNASSGVLPRSEIIRDGEETDHYALIRRNSIFIFINDCNEMESPIGRDDVVDGGYPSGAINRKSWDFIKAQIALHTTKTCFVLSHNLLKDTTIATGDNEGVNGGYHGSSGKPIASGRLEDIYDYSDGSNSSADEIITWMNNNSGKIFMWCGSHTHFKVGETYAGRGDYILKHGTHFLNVGALSRYHAGKDALCRLMLFQDGSNELNIFQYVIYSGLTQDDRIVNSATLTLTMPYNF